MGQAAIVTASNLTAGTSNVSATSFVTASITPSANKLILIGIISGSGVAHAPTGVTGCGLTWVQVCQVNVHTTVYMTVFRAMGAAPSSGALTISFGGSIDQGIGWSVDQFSNTDTSGTNGSGAIVQSATASQDLGPSVTGLTVTLATFNGLLNATYGVCGMNTFNYGINTGGNFTNLGLVSTGGAPINSQYAQTNQTSVNWTWSSENSIAAAAAAIEIKAKQTFLGGMI